MGVVTGGASGIGRALAEGLAAEGAAVVVADVDEAGLAETVKRIEARGGRALAVRTDVSDRAQVQALADRAFSALGRVHVLCNNAGVAIWGGLETATHRDWEWTLGVNLWGVIHGLEAFLPRMIAQRDGGHVVNTASMAGLIASQGLGVYNTSKYAVVGLSETLAKDLRPYGIGVSVLCPMRVATNIGASERNRAARYGGVESSPKVLDQDESNPDLAGRVLDVDDVAAMVVRAIDKKQLYILPHEESRASIRRRFERIDRAFES